MIMTMITTTMVAMEAGQVAMLGPVPMVMVGAVGLAVERIQRYPSRTNDT
jgi:cyanate permease